MKVLNLFGLSVLGVCMFTLGAFGAANNYGVQAAWDNPNANMITGSIKPGYAQLAWEAGTVLPVRMRNGMVTMVNLPMGEQIEDAVIGNDGFFKIDAEQGGRTMYITPNKENMGSDTNLIVTGKSGNIYTFYLRSEPSNASEITYSQVDVVLDGNARLPVMAGAVAPSAGAMGSIFKKTPAKSGTVGVDGEDYDWIKTMKIDPSEFRFDLDIFVPNPDDYVIAPERVWRDRVFTYIDFGDKVISMTQRPVVSLLVEGGESPVGFRTDGEDGRLLIVEAVGDMVLRSGQRIVCIKKRSKPFLIADTASVMALAEANVAQSMLSGQSLNNVLYNADQVAIQNAYNPYTTTTPMYMGNTPMPVDGMMMQSMVPAGGAMMMNMYGTQSNGVHGMNMLPSERVTAGSYLPQSNIPLITSNQGGVAVELRSDKNVKALDEYWADLLAKFSGNDGKGLLTKYKDSVFYAVDDQGVGELGASSSAGRLYRLRIGPMPDIDTAQQLCDQLLKFSGATCQVVRVQ